MIPIAIPNLKGKGILLPERNAVKAVPCPSLPETPCRKADFGCPQLWQPVQIMTPYIRAISVVPIDWRLHGNRTGKAAFSREW